MAMPTGVLLSLRDVTKVYGKGEAATYALSGVTLDVLEGEFLVILGKSGCGKTTLLNIIGGLDRPTSGSVLFEGSDYARANERALTAYRRRCVGFIFQSYNLIPTLNARENVQYVGSLTSDPMPPHEALAHVGLMHRDDYFPAQLSNGQQQRVSIACALSKRPRILLADEPTGALDHATGMEVLYSLEQAVKRGTTLLMVTHDETIARMANRVIHMNDGRISHVETNEKPARASEIA